MKKTLLISFFALLLCVAFPLFGAAEEAPAPETPAEPAARTGDLTGDGEVSAEDARLALRAAVGLEALSPAQEAIADVDKSGAVEAADARLILRLAVGLSIDDELTPREDLTDDALLQTLQSHVVIFQKTQRDGTKIAKSGLLFGADGMLLTTYEAAGDPENLEIFTADGTPVKIARVLNVNKAAGLILMQAEGDFAPLPKAEEAYAAGAELYSLRDENRVLSAGAVETWDYQASWESFRDAAVFTMKDLTVTYSTRYGMPLLDRCGAPVGILRTRENEKWVAETFASCMDRAAEGERLDLSWEDYCRRQAPVLPADRELPVEEMEKRLHNGMLFNIFKTRGNGVTDGMGFVIGDGKTLVARLSLIHHFDKLDVTHFFGDGSGEHCTVTGVLGFDEVNDIVLLRLQTAVPALTPAPAAASPGDRVYYCKDSAYTTIRQTTLESGNAAPDDPLGRQFLSFAAPEGEKAASPGSPVVDAYGRVIGVQMPYENGEEGRFYAVPIAAVEAIDCSAPMTLAEFKKLDRAPRIAAAYDEVTVQPYAGVFVPVLIDSYERTPIEVTVGANGEGKVSASLSSHASNMQILTIIVNAPCANVPVTVSRHTSYGDAAATVYVSTDEEAPLNMVGYEFAPDPGPVWGMAPTDAYADEFLTVKLHYNKANCALTDEEMFYAYTDYLPEAGFEFSGHHEISDGRCYVFTIPETDVYIKYYDCYSYVEIEVHVPA